MKDENLIIRRSRDSLAAVCERLPAIAQKHKFGILGVHDLKEKMLSKGVPFGREVRVYEVCNPQQAAAVLSRAVEISTALPCRISVYEENGQTVLASIKPTLLLSMFNAPEAKTNAQEVESATIKIMEEAAGS